MCITWCSVMLAMRLYRWTFIDTVRRQATGHRMQWASRRARDTQVQTRPASSVQDPWLRLGARLCSPMLAYAPPVPGADVGVAMGNSRSHHMRDWRQFGEERQLDTYVRGPRVPRQAQHGRGIPEIVQLLSADRRDLPSPPPPLSHSPSGPSKCTGPSGSLREAPAARGQ